jgi:hypothetical protein
MDTSTRLRRPARQTSYLKLVVDNTGKRQTATEETLGGRVDGLPLTLARLGFARQLVDCLAKVAQALRFHSVVIEAWDTPLDDDRA